MPPAVSIVLPTYERLPYLREAVESVRAQTFHDWELIVVDDGSTDGTTAWLESVGDMRIILVRLAHTGNKSLVRNAGIACARGEWIAFLDSDDRWHAEKLSRQLALHDANPNVRWSYTGRTMIDAHGDALPAERFRPWEPHSGAVLRQIVTMDANIALPSVMAHRSLLDDAGDFDPSFALGQDYELWLRLAEHSPCGLVNEPLVEIRKHRAATHKPAELSLGFCRMLRAFANRTNRPELRALATTHAAYHAVDAADRLAADRRWADARSALRMTFALKPFAPFAYRAAVRLAAAPLRPAARAL